MSASVIQRVHGTAGVTTTCTANITTTSGNAIVVIAWWGNETRTATCADNIDGTYGTAKDEITDSGAFGAASFVLNGSGQTGGARTVTITLSGNPNLGIEMEVIEVGGVKASSYDTHAALDDPSTNTNTDGMTTGNCATLTVQPALGIGWGADIQGANIPNAGTGWTSEGSGLGSGSFTTGYRTQSKRVTSTTAFASTTTATAAGDSFFSMMVVLSELSGPTIDTQPTKQRVYEGQTANFSVSATSTGGTLHYQWKKNGSNVGTDSSSYTTGTLTIADDLSTIVCAVSDDNGTTNSTTVYLCVYEVPPMAWIRA